ncbi:MAG: asparagine synthase (glutamine-hydrolyzing) [Rhodospirillaceae bacterium]|jgi:asparagine synthase (glutamine-hydrolysing)|nr:asparagine synthase (glutamine-hydrolyzing) [Rhodospirillaceae bacterium]MBT6139461.1 asparagine synthase (glutamine-hydrolyzing) [Rhodospirillaceae bacterium]
MCGLTAIFRYQGDGPPVQLAEVERITASMAARGPDGAGHWLASDGLVGLGHRRLAIIDTSPAGAQPLWDAVERRVIVFNGEIYNYRALRAELHGLGHVFRTESDTEVLLALYDRYGATMVEHLRGMYTFVIWDTGERRLFAARDPFGIKPLYYADDGTTVRLASQVKALVAGGAIATDPSSAGLAGFLLLGYVPDPHTHLAAVQALPPGHTLECAEGETPKVRRYLDLSAELAAAEPVVLSEAGRVERLRTALDASLERHMVADVPVGAFLSAGLDSSAIVSRLAASGAPSLRTVTLGFQEYIGRSEDETEIASLTAERNGCIHDTRWIAREDFSAAHDRLLQAMDQPSIDGVNTYFVARATAETGLKVALSGLGADELLGGYPSFNQVPRLAGSIGRLPIPGFVARGTRMLLSPILSGLTSAKYAGVLEYGRSIGDAYLLRRGLFMPWELERILDRETAREGLARLDLSARLQATADPHGSPRAAVSALEKGWYMSGQLLRDADWAGMAHSLEIRVPFVDLDLFRDLAPLIAGDNPPVKRDLVALAGDRLPEAARNRAKTGFSVPVRDWLADPEAVGGERGLRGWARHVLDEGFGVRLGG